jgi:hypothetical protein
MTYFSSPTGYLESALYVRKAVGLLDGDTSLYTADGVGVSRWETCN